MKIAYFILAHHKFYQFRWLWQAVYSPNDIFCVHVDAKASDKFHSDVRNLVAHYPNVVLLPRRSIAWSGWSMVETELAAMRQLSAREYSWDYWINLSGQDYPIQSRATLHDVLTASSDNFIRSWSFDEVAAVEPNDVHLRMRMYVELAGKIRRLPVKLPLPHEYRFKGSTWHMLRREFVEWVLNSDLTRKAARYIRFQFCPDELFFQALIMHSPFRDARKDSGRFVLWPGPKILDQADDAAMLKAADCMFGRKFDAQIDSEILHRLAKRCGYDVPNDAA